MESGVDVARFAFADFVHGCSHVVVDATPGDATKHSKGSGVSVEEHFVGLGIVGDQYIRSAGCEFDVRDFESSVQAANE